MNSWNTVSFKKSNKNKEKLSNQTTFKSKLKSDYKSFLDNSSNNKYSRFIKCKYCNEFNHTISQCFKLKNHLCNNCLQYGHTIKYCKNKKFLQPINNNLIKDEKKINENEFNLEKSLKEDLISMKNITNIPKIVENKQINGIWGKNIANHLQTVYNKQNQELQILKNNNKSITKTHIKSSPSPYFSFLKKKNDEKQYKSISYNSESDSDNNIEYYDNKSDVSEYLSNTYSDNDYNDNDDYDYDINNFDNYSDDYY